MTDAAPEPAPDAQRDALLTPPPAVRPAGWSDEDWEQFLAEEKETRPSAWRLEDGTIYSRNTPSWMYDDNDGNLLVDSMAVVEPGDPNYDFFAGTVSDFYDYYNEGDEESEPEPEFSWYDAEED